MRRGHPLERRCGSRLVGETDDEPSCHLGTEHAHAAGGHGACRLAGRKKRHATPRQRFGATGRGSARERGRVHGVERSGDQRVEIGVQL
jgi:hypothetical protein